MAEKPDVVNQFTGDSWAYSPEVRDHFFHPRNLLLAEGADEGSKDPESSPRGSASWDSKFDGVGQVGSPACGDVMRVWLKIDGEQDKITEFKWRTFGCASAIAATSMLSVMVTENGGMKIDDALKIRPQDILARLGGLPDRKIHCSVLGDKALRAALNDWFRKTDQFARIENDGAKVIDPQTKTTEADIEEAVLHGARTLEELQAQTKVGIGNPDCLPAAEELLRFYIEKHLSR